MIIQKLKESLVLARKAKNTAQITFYSTLIGEIESIGKSAGNRATTDEEAIRHILKWMKSIDETISLRGEGVCTELLMEKKLCEQFLPSMLSEQETKDAVAKAISEVGKNQGLVMKWMKDKYPNRYNGAQASSYFKELTQ